MFRRKQQPVENEAVARSMRKFFKKLPDELRRDHRMLAKSYGEFLWDGVHQRLAAEKGSSRSRYYVGLSIGDSGRDFDDITKRATLISDTLLLSHHRKGDYHDITESHNPDLERPASPPVISPHIEFPRIDPEEIWHEQGRWDQDHLEEMCVMDCPSLDDLGRWILDAQPLLTEGLVWYLPSYASAKYRIIDGVREPLDEDNVTVIDYLIQDGRAVDASGAEPRKSQLVRPVLQIDLPFIDGVNLQDFSKITIGEFGSYSGFRRFLRQRFQDMDTALNAVQSDCELRKLGDEIKDKVLSQQSKMEAARRKRAVAVTGAVLGTVGATLVAVYGQALADAVAILCASDSVWDIIRDTLENSPRALRQDKWYYVWALDNKSGTSVT